jgi:hypothetical protein
MTAEQVITIQLCGLADAQEYTPPCATSSRQSSAEGIITVGLAPADASAVIVVPLRHASIGDPYACDKIQECLSLRRDPIYDFPQGEDPVVIRMTEYAYLRVRHHGHCAWRETLLTAHGAGNDPTGRFLTRYFPANIYDFSQIDDCQDFRPGQSDWQILSNAELAPGMQVNARYILHAGGPMTTYPCGYVWYHTCSMTGGTILSIQGDHDTPAVRYTVDAENKTLTGVRSSDFVPYSVGDWVFLVRQNDACPMACDELGEGLLGGPDKDGETIDGSSYMIVPFKVGSRGA